MRGKSLITGLVVGSLLSLPLGISGEEKIRAPPPLSFSKLEVSKRPSLTETLAEIRTKREEFRPNWGREDTPLPKCDRPEYSPLKRQIIPKFKREPIEFTPVPYELRKLPSIDTVPEWIYHPVPGEIADLITSEFRNIGIRNPELNLRYKKTPEGFIVYKKVPAVGVAYGGEYDWKKGLEKDAGLDAIRNAVMEVNGVYLKGSTETQNGSLERDEVERHCMGPARIKSATYSENRSKKGKKVVCNAVVEVPVVKYN